MLISREVEVTINYKNIKRYKELGYKFESFVNKEGNISARKGVKIFVKIEHLQINSGAIVEYKCDYCGDIIFIRYCDYMKHYQNGIKLDKDACRKCNNIKIQTKYNRTSPFSSKEVRDKRDNTVKEKYGVNNIFKVKEVKEKIIQTNIEKYGVKSYTQTDEYKEKSKATCLEKYGYDNVSKSPEIIDKIKQVQFDRYGDFYSNTPEYKEKYKNTCIEKYGVENVFQTQGVKDKILEYNYLTYGASHPMKVEKVKNERFKKMVETKYRNGSGQSSRQQDYLHKLYGGEINYPVDKCSLDIAFIDNKIYCEYDGSGHSLSVNFKDSTEEEFLNKEIKRKYFLLSLGWREFRIISPKDYLPCNEILIDIKTISEKWFDKGHKWIKFYIDENKYETSEGFVDYNFGKLRKIKEEDLETA